MQNGTGAKSHLSSFQMWCKAGHNCTTIFGGFTYRNNKRQIFNLKICAGWTLSINIAFHLNISCHPLMELMISDTEGLVVVVFWNLRTKLSPKKITFSHDIRNGSRVMHKYVLKDKLPIGLVL